MKAFTLLLFLAGIASGLIFQPPVYAMEYKHGILVFGGPYSKNDIWDTMDILGADYESNRFLGLAWNHDIFTLGKWAVTRWELGLGSRFANPWSVEIWGGWAVRLQGLPLGPILVKPSVSFGLSYVTATMGTERVRMQDENAHANLLFYLGPEMSLALKRYPRWEIAYRLHHRSGGGGTLGRMYEGHNANTIGVRYQF